jgi:hypothetical protein
MSFLELLKQSREKAQYEIQQIQNLKPVEEKIEQEHLIDENVENKSIYNIKQEIVKSLKFALKQTKNKYHTPKLAKQAQKLLKNDKLYLSDFEQCFNELKHRNDNKRLDFWLLGGEAMLQLQKYLKIGITLNQALEMPYEEKNEK